MTKSIAKKTQFCKHTLMENILCALKYGCHNKTSNTISYLKYVINSITYNGIVTKAP